MRKTIVMSALKDVRVQEQTVYETVQAVFFAHPQKAFTLTELAKEVGAGKKTTSSIVEKLGEEGFLVQHVIGKAWQLQAVTNHKYFMTRKVPLNIRMVYESGAVDAVLARWPAARAVILFGSYRYGQDIDESDVDIAVEVADVGETQVIELGRADLGVRKRVKFNCHVFNKKTVDRNLFVNIANGIVLTGLLEVQP